ncbi:hypothetical protein AKJ09_00366 [Labilithrix luteola]|uniref:Uncharacterized protein n=1 Tax=Labilithrix luteola TaxID=1391654 RepID=A0A0K1PJL7_9BACT|nr:hypothetical protein [Labilithrix luteola]AKU93702.1 hypothetical protein AKJ09_00366 [Labilithrix luteola]
MFAPPHMLVTRAVGHLDTSMAEEWIRRSPRLFTSTRPIAIFNDWDLLESYDSKARTILTEWVLDHRTKIEGAWFLTGSRMVAMGVAVAGAATAIAGITLNASLNRPRWETLLRERLAEGDVMQTRP